MAIRTYTLIPLSNAQAVLTLYLHFSQNLLFIFVYLSIGADLWSAERINVPIL